MRLKLFSLKNFRGYREQVQIDMSDLTVFVGRNDIGKSTILEALDIFFNDKVAVNIITLRISVSVLRSILNCMRG